MDGCRAIRVWPAGDRNDYNGSCQSSRAARNVEKRCAEFFLSGRMIFGGVVRSSHWQSRGTMSDPQVIQRETQAPVTPRGLPGGARLVVHWMVGTMLAFLIGSWLVWWAVTLQRQFAEDEIRAACQRMMPETVQRCVDTVVIQRGGARR